MKEDINKKIKFFYKNNVYTYIRLYSKTFFNGYITKEKSDDNKSILFKDDFIGDTPIEKSNIDILDYSMKKKGDVNGK